MARMFHKHSPAIGEKTDSHPWVMISVFFSAKGAAQRLLLNHFSVKFCDHDAFKADLIKMDGDDLERGQGGTILTYL